MKLRSTLPLFVGLVLAGCAGDTAEDSAEATEMASAENEMAEGTADTSADRAALADLAQQFQTHYNLHHASMVADFYADSAVALMANGGVQEGRDAIEARLATEMEGEPTLSLNQQDAIIAGDWAITHGSWSAESTADGQPMAMAGNYMSAANKIDGEWKLMATLTNYNAPPPEGMARGETPDEPPANEGTMTDLVNYYQTHYNMGHGSMVASRYAEDAWASFAGQAPVQGRAAVEAALQSRIDAGASDLVIHDVFTMPMDNGMRLDVGWYEMNSPDGPMNGAYMLVAEQGDDGTWLIKWQASNLMPAEADGM